jgi:hypothetical protein
VGGCAQPSLAEIGRSFLHAGAIKVEQRDGMAVRRQPVRDAQTYARGRAGHDRDAGAHFALSAGVNSM